MRCIAARICRAAGEPTRAIEQIDDKIGWQGAAQMDRHHGARKARADDRDDTFRLGLPHPDASPRWTARCYLHGVNRRHRTPYYAASKAGTGNAVTDLIFSMAKRDVTFLSATALMSFL